MQSRELDLEGECGSEIDVGVRMGHRRWRRAHNGKSLQAGRGDSEEVGERFEVVDRLVWDVRERQVPEVREDTRVPPQRDGVQLNDLEARGVSAEDGGRPVL